MEILNKWEPTKGLSKKYKIEKILDTDEFEVILYDISNNKKKIKLLFPNSVHSYYRSLEKFNNQCKFTTTNEWTFFKIDNSAYLKWLSHQSFGISDTRNLIHFSIFATNSTLDIINPSEPIVKLMQ